MAAPEIFHRITEAEAHMLGDRDAFDAGRMASVMSGMIHRIVHGL